MENVLSPGETVSLMSPADLQEGVASLSKGAYFKEASLDMTLSILTESAARMSGVERVSIWALTDAQRELRCLELFELSTGLHSSGETLRERQYPAYFRALRKQVPIVADEPYLHPATAELGVGYLFEHAISSRLDTPIHIRGELQGVFCLEQVGSHVLWTSEHRLFAQAVANLVTLALVEYEADEARRQAQSASERLQTVFMHPGMRFCWQMAKTASSSMPTVRQKNSSAVRGAIWSANINASCIRKRRKTPSARLFARCSMGNSANPSSPKSPVPMVRFRRWKLPRKLLMSAMVVDWH